MSEFQSWALYYLMNLTRIEKIIQALEDGDSKKALERAKWAYERAKEGPSND
jgi:exonuclease VII small subunit